MMPQKKLSDEELRQLANITLKATTDLCLIMSPTEVRIYLDYVISGITSFNEGFTNRDA